MRRRRFLAGGLAGMGALVARRAGADAPDTVSQAFPHQILVPGIAADGLVTAAPTLREKIGQMLLVGFRGLTVEPGRVIAADIAERNISGVVLYSYDVPSSSTSRNIESPEQLNALTGQLRGLREEPLFIAVDQEGGAVARLSPENGFPETVSAAELGAIDNPQVTYDMALAMASTLAAAGINLNFAPVVDLNVNPDNPVIGALDRSFSADPAVVIRNAGAFIRAHHDRGVLCALKHFPGHGSSEADSHLGFVDVTDTWSEIELEPFAAIVADGLADMVMTAHVFNANLDPDYPATLSFNTITNLLRRDLGYEGVVISDDMQMAAISDQYGFDFAVEKAVQAGVDILLFGNNLQYDEAITLRVIDLIESLVADGVVSEGRIDLSYQRIMALRSRL